MRAVSWAVVSINVRCTVIIIVQGKWRNAVWQARVGIVPPARQRATGQRERHHQKPDVNPT